MAWNQLAFSTSVRAINFPVEILVEILWTSRRPGTAVIVGHNSRGVSDRWDQSSNATCQRHLTRTGGEMPWRNSPGAFPCRLSIPMIVVNRAYH